MKMHQWVHQFRNGEFESNDVKVQIQAGWHDWFCKESALAPKTAKYGKLICDLYIGSKVDSGLEIIFCHSSSDADRIYIGDWLIEFNKREGVILFNTETVGMNRAYASGLTSIKKFFQGPMDIYA